MHLQPTGSKDEQRSNAHVSTLFYSSDRNDGQGGLEVTLHYKHGSKYVMGYCHPNFS